MILGRSRFVGLFALASFVATIGLPFVAPGHAFGDDVDEGWGEQPVAFGGTVSKLGSVRPPRTNEHCALCHWARALRASVAADPVRCNPPIVIGAALVSRSASCPTPTWGSGSSRGPPTAL